MENEAGERPAPQENFKSWAVQVVVVVVLALAVFAAAAFVTMNVMGDGNDLAPSEKIRSELFDESAEIGSQPA